MRTARPGPQPDLLVEALQSRALFQAGSLAACIAGLIASVRRHLPECSVAVMTVDRATRTVVGVTCSDDVADETLAPAIALLDGIFSAPGLDAGPAPPPNPLPDMDPALWVCREISDRLNAVVIVWRENDFGAFGELDVATVAAFAEAVAAILRLRIAHDGETVNRLCSLFDQSGMGFIVLDGAMNLQHTNDRGGKLIASRAYLTRDGDRLEASNGALAARLRHNIANLLVEGPAQADGALILPLQNSNDASVIKAMVLRLRTVQDRLAGPALAALVIPFAGPDSALSASELQAMGFTKAEAHLAVALLDGMTVKEYARARGRAVPTVRAQLKRAMTRLNVHRQADLVRVLVGLKNSRVT